MWTTLGLCDSTTLFSHPFKGERRPTWHRCCGKGEHFPTHVKLVFLWFQSQTDAVGWGPSDHLLETLDFGSESKTSEAAAGVPLEAGWGGAQAARRSVGKTPERGFPAVWILGSHGWRCSRRGLLQKHLSAVQCLFPSLTFHLCSIEGHAPSH